MWIHTVNGFVSIVKHKHIPNCLLVRGRVKADLEAILGDEYEITTEPGSDYTYRAIVDAEDIAIIIADAIMDIDYTSHFKDVTIKRAPKVEHGSRSQALYAIWNAMANLQGYRPYSTRPRSAESIVSHKGYDRRYPDDALFDDGWTQQPGGSWTRRPTPKGSSTTKATTGHYDWSQHPQSATYNGGKGGNVTMAKALEVLDEIADEGIVLDDVAEEAAIEEAEQDPKTERSARIDELTEYALENFPEANEWTVDDWQGYYKQNLDHQEFVESVTGKPVDTDAEAEAQATIAALPEGWTAAPDEVAKADWESLQTQETLRSGPSGKPVSATKAAVKPGPTATKARTRRAPAAKK